MNDLLDQKNALGPRWPSQHLCPAAAPLHHLRRSCFEQQDSRHRPTGRHLIVVALLLSLLLATQAARAADQPCSQRGLLQLAEYRHSEAAAHLHFVLDLLLLQMALVQEQRLLILLNAAHHQLAHHLHLHLHFHLHLHLLQSQNLLLTQWRHFTLIDDLFYPRDRPE